MRLILAQEKKMWSMVVKKTALHMFELQLFMLKMILQTFYTFHKRVLDLIFIYPKKQSSIIKTTAVRSY